EARSAGGVAFGDRGSGWSLGLRAEGGIVFRSAGAAGKPVATAAGTGLAGQWYYVAVGGRGGRNDGRRELLLDGGLASTALGAAEAGYLETLLACAFPGRRLIFRTMAWEGDTADRQGRMVNFESWPRQLDRVGAGVVIAQFGKTEALAGRAGVGRFVAAYE